MSFMNAEITDKQWWLQIDGNEGIEFIPEMLFSVEQVRNILALENYQSKLKNGLRDFIRSREVFEAELVYGYGVRYSAAGYMDCTDWTVYTNKREAVKAARQEQRECDGQD